MEGNFEFSCIVFRDDKEAQDITYHDTHYARQDVGRRPVPRSSERLDQRASSAAEQSSLPKTLSASRRWPALGKHNCCESTLGAHQTMRGYSGPGKVAQV
jgi:hypothetical protein